MKKRLISTLLALCMVLVLLPGTVLAAEPANGTCGDNLTWTLDANGTLTISGTGAMEDYIVYKDDGNYVTAPWTQTSNLEIQTVTISDGVTTIGEGAFAGLQNLISVTIPNSVTSIGWAAFVGCISLTSVTIPDSVTSIGGAAFDWCISLSSVTIPNSVTSIEYGTFAGCSSLTSVTIPDSVTSIGWAAFVGCSSLTNVYYSGSERQWEQISIDSSTWEQILIDSGEQISNDLFPWDTDENANAPLLDATIHYGGASLELTPAVKYVYYSETLPASWQVVSSSLPDWLKSNGNVLSGIPTQAGEYQIRLTDGSTTETVTLTVRENGDNSVRGSNSDGYVVVQEFPDILQEESVWIIDDAHPLAPGEPDIFDRLLDVYLDGRKLKGGKLEDGQQIPDDWEYYARRGSLMTTLLTQTKANNTQGQHTLSVTISKPSNNSVSTTTAVDTVSTNYYVSSYDPQTENYPFSDGEGTRYRDAIRYLVESGVITGFGDGTFRPKAELTRAQACAILARATGNGSASGTATFTDTSGHWAEGAIAWCASKGIVSGYGNGRFGPEEQLTGYAWSKMLFVALGFDAEAYGLVGSSWESNVMSLLREKGLDQGMNNFYPEQTIKREEACQLVYNAFVQKLISA